MNQLNHVKSLVLQTVLLTESKRGQFKDRCRVARITQHWVTPTRRPLLQGCHSPSRPPSTDNIRFQLWHSSNLQKALSPKWSRKMLKDLQLVSDIVRYANPCKSSSSVVATAASSLCCWEFLVAFAAPYKLNP